MQDRTQHTTQNGMENLLETIQARSKIAMGTGEASGKKKEDGYVCVMTFSSILFGSPNSKANLKIISLFHSLFISQFTTKPLCFIHVSHPFCRV